MPTDYNLNPTMAAKSTQKTVDALHDVGLKVAGDAVAQPPLRAQAEQQGI
jgi:hypothetical protein